MKIPFWTSDPVRDAEMYAYDTRPVIGTCEECGHDIHGKDKDYYEDDAYCMPDGAFVCADCLRDYCNRHYRI